MHKWHFESVLAANGMESMELTFSVTHINAALWPMHFMQLNTGATFQTDVRRMILNNGCGCKYAS